MSFTKFSVEDRRIKLRHWPPGMNLPFMPPFFVCRPDISGAEISSALPSRRLSHSLRAALWVDRNPGLILLALLTFYCVLVVLQATLKLLWADELITLSIALQPGMTSVWRALVAGADPNPPLIHLMVKASTYFFGVGPLAVRLPAMSCIFCTLAFLWMILRRWVRPTFAVAGVMVFMATRGFDYAYDARSYAPLMAFTVGALALWIWLPNTYGWRRALLCTGLTAALAGAISSNYYGVLALLPVAAGELARVRLSKRMDTGVWLAMLLGLAPLFCYLPLIRHNLAEFGPHAWNRPAPGMVVSSYLELVEAIFWPTILLAGYALRKRLVRFRFPRPEFVAMGVLLLFPFLGFGLARAGSAMISPRCVAPVCCGFGLAAGLLCQRVFGRAPRAGLAVVLFLLTWVTVREAMCARLLLDQRHAFLALRDEVQRDVHGRILVADSAFALPLFFYSSKEVQARMVFPIDFVAIHRYEADDSGEENLWAGRSGVFPFPIVPLSSLYPLQAGDLALARPDGWLAHEVEAAGVQLAPVPSRVEGKWGRLGGVFTPMGHAETRELRVVASRGDGMMEAP